MGQGNGGQSNGHVNGGQEPWGLLSPCDISPCHLDSMGSEYQVQIVRKDDHQSLGLTLDDDAKCPRIIDIKDGGLVDKWNRGLSRKSVDRAAAGDFIVAVNEQRVLCVTDFLRSIKYPPPLESHDYSSCHDADPVSNINSAVLTMTLKRQAVFEFCVTIQRQERPLGLTLEAESRLPRVADVTPGGAVLEWNSNSVLTFQKVRQGDVILRVGDTPVRSLNEFQAAVRGKLKLEMRLLHEPEIEFECLDEIYAA